MPYDVHITKAKSWLLSKNNPIVTDEVNQLVDSDSELSWSQSDYIEMLNDKKETVRHYAILWNGQPKFLHVDGEIRCSNPDKKTIAKMREIAKELGAIVQGDEDEVYK